MMFGKVEIVENTCTLHVFALYFWGGRKSSKPDSDINCLSHQEPGYLFNTGQ